MARVTRALALLLLAGAGTAHAQGGFLRVEILPPDNRVVENDSGTTPIVVTFVLTSANGSGSTSVNWTTTPGSALAGSDFVSAGGTVTWAIFDSTPKTRIVQVQNDLVDEWNPDKLDEQFFIDLSAPVGASGIERGRATVTIVDDDASQPGVQFLSAVTDSTSSAFDQGRNRLQWRIPAAAAPPTEIRIAWTSGPSICGHPTSDTAGEAPAVSLLGPFTAGAKHGWTHDLSHSPRVQIGKYYCYSVFIYYPGLSAERGEVKVRTFDSTSGPMKWAFSAGRIFNGPAPSVVPPSVGIDAIYTVGADGAVHAMRRGDAGGTWPANWEPVSLGKPAHNRSPVVEPASVVGSRLFVGTEDGEVHAVDGRTGEIVWSRSPRFAPASPRLLPGALGNQATPAGIFKRFGGHNDVLLVGTAAGLGNSKFFALNPATGATIDQYPSGGDTPPGPMDDIVGMAVVDYGATNRVYFGTKGTSETVWALDTGGPGTVDLTLSAYGVKPAGAASGTMGSLVSRGGILYFGTDTGALGRLQGLRLSDGFQYFHTHGDGQLKGFPWPDRRNGQLYFSTAIKVHGVDDNGSVFAPLPWSPITWTSSPSIVLQKPGTDDIYFGDGQGRLVKLTLGSTSWVQLETGAIQIGAPSLDMPNDLVHVGSDKGVIYAVRF